MVITSGILNFLKSQSPKENEKKKYGLQKTLCRSKFANNLGGLWLP